ncbi:hypothetical protein LJC61_01240 [Ruminococcaceae bacterium OttesenSCG-928-A16]|nr:hypothetical protein [Ruminococcaceae bacterium OttesenSCG-928-A16]
MNKREMWEPVTLTSPAFTNGGVRQGRGYGLTRYKGPRQPWKGMFCSKVS